MAKRTVKKSKSKSKGKSAKARTSAKKARAAETTAAATINYAPAPFESASDHNPSKAPGKQHRHPAASLVGVKHSDQTIAKARTSFNRRISNLR